MRRPAAQGKRDANQSSIIEALEAAGATVQDLGTVGGGCPDLLVGYAGANHLLEVKDPSKSKGDRELNEKQKAWHARWRGQRAKVETAAEALRAIGAPLLGVA